MMASPATQDMFLICCGLTNRSGHLKHLCGLTNYAGPAQTASPTERANEMFPTDVGVLTTPVSPYLHGLTNHVDLSAPAWPNQPSWRDPSGLTNRQEPIQA